jgi:hypothetical protein
VHSPRVTATWNEHYPGADRSKQSAYYQALEAADSEWANKSIDVSMMEELLEGLLGN